ncbi:MAG: CvpA family protein [Bacilli bacterium]|nr:CvpA family protein [Bacilli bacterium]
MNLLNLFDATFQFDWLSLVLIGVLVLIPALRGLIKGGAFMFFRFIAGALILVAAYFLAKPLAGLLANMGLGGVIREPILGFLVSKSDLAAQASPGKETVQAILSANNYKAVTDMGVPGLFAKSVADYVVGVIPVEASEITIGYYIADALAILALSVIAFIAIWLILTIISGIIHHAIEKRHEEKGIPGISRLIGMLIGLAIGAVAIVTAFYVVTLLTAIPVVKDFINGVWQLENPDVMTIGKWLYEANFFQYLSGYFL